MNISSRIKTVKQCQKCIQNNEQHKVKEVVKEENVYQLKSLDITKGRLKKNVSNFYKK